MPPPSIFGPWATEDRLNALQTEFAQAQPFPHIVIDDFFNAELAHALENEFPIQAGETNKEAWQSLGWHVYDNPIEGKLAFDRISALDICFQTTWNALQSPENVARLRKITGIQDLETDPYVHGAGLHYHPERGRLELHLDYSIHPFSGMERRVNLIVYLNSNWRQEWGGDLQLWEATRTSRRNLRNAYRRSSIGPFSSALPTSAGTACQTSSNALTTPAARASPYTSCRRPPPQRAARRLRSGHTPIARRAGNYLELCKIRSKRLLTPEDVSQHMPEWTPRWLP